MEEFSSGPEAGKSVKVVILVVETPESAKKDTELLPSHPGLDHITKEKKLSRLKVVIPTSKVDAHPRSVYCDGGEGDVWIVKNVPADT